MVNEPCARKVRTSTQSKDIREFPTYGVAETVHYLQIPQTTLRSRVVGRRYPTGDGTRFFEPFITPPDPNRSLLSFMNVVEVHVLDAIRRQHQTRLAKIRQALQHLRQHFPSRHPLAGQTFATDGLDLFIQRYGRRINIGQSGQLAMRNLLEAHLQWIERDRQGIAIRLYPFTRKCLPDEPRLVVIDPYMSFGRPTLTSSGIATAMIAERYKAGESVDEIADDYGRDRLEIEEAIRCELQIEAT
jgi:uncharacterized protein (DUF433 family)